MGIKNEVTLKLVLPHNAELIDLLSNKLSNLKTQHHK